MTDSITEHDDENAPDIAQIVADKENIGYVWWMLAKVTYVWGMFVYTQKLKSYNKPVTWTVEIVED
jgi:hypothetical protein